MEVKTHDSTNYTPLGAEAPPALLSPAVRWAARKFQIFLGSFSYRQDPKRQLQYGLIAEEVAKVYPELVVRNDKGEIESVQYRELIPLMLNEMQHMKAENAALEARLLRLEQVKLTALP